MSKLGTDITIGEPVFTPTPGVGGIPPSISDVPGATLCGPTVQRMSIRTGKVL